ncbi:uncharacterized protein LOC120003619 [Tripterygium wilfordii]|uniref:uncharacterized protein LOC120003619 n=1 Tax=Tripterygium wilfordii TaxID=458696 RepID=UPI0018F8411E|nr:uncharacterized protein LOC120003619 [Tripterygium wilfordii]
MALNLSPPLPLCLIPKHKHRSRLCSSSFRASAQSERNEGGVTEEGSPAAFSGSLSSSRTQLDLLEQLTSTAPSVDGYESDGISGELTIREQLAQLVGEREGDFSIPLGKDLKKVSA